MADGHDPEKQSSLTAFLAEGIKSREDLETAMMAAIVRQTSLLNNLTLLTGALMRFTDKSQGNDTDQADAAIEDLNSIIAECRQINAALIEYSGRDQEVVHDGEQ